MYIYLKKINSVITCEEYPQVLTIEEMKLKKLEYMCNKWEKNDNNDETFTLSYKYEKEKCECNNSQYKKIEDYNDYECYNCGRKKTNEFEEGMNLYLQNSGNMDIVCVKPKQKNCKLCKVIENSNIYKWINNDDKMIFALHIKDNKLCDENIGDNINNMKDECYIEFTNDICI
jgi:hypothetical protein